jgi:hypothetical protein
VLVYLEVLSQFLDTLGKDTDLYGAAAGIGLAFL